MITFAGLLMNDERRLGTRLQSALNERVRRVTTSTSVARITESRFAALVWGDAQCASAIEKLGNLVAVGSLRLDNRSELNSTEGRRGRTTSDLNVLLSAYARIGPAVFERLCGDFSLLIWDGEREQLYALRDPMGIKRIFWTCEEGEYLLSSNLDVVHSVGAVDETYARWYLCGGSPYDPSATIWADARAVAPGGLLAVSRAGHAVRRYWTPGRRKEFVPKNEDDQCQVFRAHLHTAVRSRLVGIESVWSELSGGLDSASVLATVCDLQSSGRTITRLGGTYTFVDDMAGADERPFLNAVLRQYDVPNESLKNYYAWQDDGEPPPVTEEPRLYYPFWARDRRAQRIVSAAGAQFVLSGMGSDHYLTGSPVFVADLLALGQISAALAQAHGLATAWRQSFWGLFWHFGLSPLLTPDMARAVAPSAPALPWVRPSFLSRLKGQNPPAQAAADDAFGSYSNASAAHQLGAASSQHELPLTSPAVEKLYPFFDRAMIDFALSLAPTMLLRGSTSKWILRQSSSQRFPEIVRNRISKGLIDGRTCWALSEKEALLSRILRDPIIGQAGWVDPGELRHAVAAARSGLTAGVAYLMRALSLETWLLVKLGQWPAEATS